MKTCSKCKQEKSLEDFHKNKNSKDGLASRCRACTSEYNRKRYAEDPDYREKSRRQSAAWQKANPERQRELLTKWQKANPERYREHTDAWQKRNPERVRENGRAWREANPERVRELGKAWKAANQDRIRELRAINRERDNERSKAWRNANLDKVRASATRRRQENLEKFRARDLQWHRDNPEKSRANRQRRRALEKNALVKDKVTIEMLMETYGDKCMNPECGSQDRLTLDHIVPLARGGVHGFENSQVLCKSCNSSKGAKTIDYRPIKSVLV